MKQELKFNTILQIWDDYKCWCIFSDDGRVSCKLSIYNDNLQDAFISDLYVDESIRKQGCATAILNWCSEYAKDRGCNSLSLRSDNDDWVREWYKRLGFKVEYSQVWLTKNIDKLKE